MGLLKAEQNQVAEAKKYLRKALKTDPDMHEAAYNLGTLLAADRPGESVDLLFKAFELYPNPKYAYTLAFYLNQNQDLERADRTLEFMIQHWPHHADAYLLLTEIRLNQDKKTEAIQLLRQALSLKDLTSQDRYRLAAKLHTLESSNKDVQ
jgi:tetratricopeptide (TPR) repeat protein